MTVTDNEATVQKKQTGAWLPADLYHRLKVEAAKKDTSISAVMTAAVAEYLERQQEAA